MSKPKGRSPDYILKVKHKESEDTAKQGAGWLNEDGSITINLDLCCVLTRDKNLLITLFPNDKQPTP